MAAYKFRVLLDNAENEEIFRDIEINDNSSFEEFYQTIIKSFKFSGEQMASFYVSNDDWDKGEEIGLFDMELDDGSEFHLMSTSLLRDFITSTNQRYILVYDFLKMWCFLIELIQITDENLDTPNVSLSIGISPDENTRDMNIEMVVESKSDNLELGDDFDDIFSEFNDEDDFGGFENIDDLDI